MFMKKYLSLFLLAAVLAGVLTLTACGGELDGALVGEWEWEEITLINLIFEEGGRGRRNWDIDNFETYRWTTNGDRLTINRDSHPRDELRNERWTYTLSNNNNTLTIQSQQRNETHRVYRYYRVMFEQAFVGLWEFRDDTDYFLAFDANGSGRRNWFTHNDAFTWTTSGGHHLSMADGDYLDRWTFNLTNGENTLTITSRDEPGLVYVYNRVR
jgi:hypothetical protein